MRSLLANMETCIELSAAEVVRAEQLQAMGFRTYDALHLACAESAGANVFLTTDDQLARVAKRHSEELNISVRNPLLWLLEMMQA